MPILGAPVDGTATVTLTLGSTTLELDSDVMSLETLDLGYPDVRVVSDPRQGSDGARDRTSNHGARAVTATLLLLGSDRMRTLDDLRAFCHPSLRPTLTIDASWWDQPRQMVLRSDKQSAPIQGKDGETLPVQVQWEAPDGVLEAVDESQVTVPASGRASAGISFPLSFPLSMPAGVFSGIVTAQSFGSTFSDPVVAMYGPCTAPVLSCDGQGALSFPSLTISAGDYVELNFRNRTVLYNGVADASRYRTLDFATATWWRLARGINTVRYTPASYGDAAAAVVTWRDSWL